MAFGLYLVRDGSVMVAYGQRHIPISGAQYKANGYKPPLEKLAVKSPAIQEGADCGHIPHSASIASAFAGSSLHTVDDLPPAPDAALVTHR